MSDSNGSSPTVPTVNPPESGADGRGVESDKSGSWLGRIMSAVGIRASAASLRQNLETVLDEADDGGSDTTFSADEREMIRNILRLRETRVEDVMVPRAEIEAVPDEITLNDLMLKFRASGHSRMPVYRETLDDAEHMVHIRDLMAYIAEAATVRASRVATRDVEPSGLYLTQVDLSVRLAETGILREVLVVPGAVPIADLIKQMQSKRLQMALVIDEYGGVDGLVSLEDLVEAVVGDIEDEHDVVGPVEIARVGADVWDINGQTDLDDVAAATGADLSACGVSEDVDTVGGLVVALAGRVPAVGERITTPELEGYAFEIVEADQLRVKRLRVERTEAPAPSETRSSAA